MTKRLLAVCFSEPKMQVEVNSCGQIIYSRFETHIKRLQFQRAKNLCVRTEEIQITGEYQWRKINENLFFPEKE